VKKAPSGMYACGELQHSFEPSIERLYLSLTGRVTRSIIEVVNLPPLVLRWLQAL
jgi:hypothetical protein